MSNRLHYTGSTTRIEHICNFRSLHCHAMSNLATIDSGVIYRNPHPGHRVINAFYPATYQRDNGDILCIVRVAGALYSPEGMLDMLHSADGGKTWEHRGPIIDRADDRVQYNYLDGYFTRLGDGTLVIRAMRCDQHDGRFMFNEKTGGLLPLEMVLIFSDDDGETWSAPQVCETFEQFDDHQMPAPYSPLIELPGGAWMQTFETWKPYDHTGPYDLQIYGLYSNDRGKTWGDKTVIANGAPEDKSFSHAIPVKLDDGRLFMSSWGATPQFDDFIGNWAVVSTDATGRTWEKPYDMRVPGQSSCACNLGDGRLLVAYSHRDNTEQPGIKVALSTDDGKTFDTDNALLAWDAYGREALGVPKTDKYPAAHDAIAYGAPKMMRLSDNEAMVTFWATQGADTHCRWTSVRV